MPTTTSTDRTHPASCSCLADPSDWYTSYSAAIRRYLITRCRDPLAAEECTSETFVRAIARRHTFRCGGDGVRPWLFAIARNIAHDFNHKAWRRYEVPAESIADAQDVALTPEQVVVQRESWDELRRCLANLPVEQGRCLNLRFFSDLSVERTANAMCRGAGAVRALQYRAVRNLAEELTAADRDVHVPRQRTG